MAVLSKGGIRAKLPFAPCQSLVNDETAYRSLGQRPVGACKVLGHLSLPLGLGLDASLLSLTGLGTEMCLNFYSDPWIKLSRSKSESVPVGIESASGHHISLHSAMAPS